MLKVVAEMAAKEALKRAFDPEDIQTSPHRSFYIGVTMVAIAAIATVVACGVAVFYGMTSQAIAVGVVGGVMTGSVALMSFYLLRFSRDHNIVKARLSQAAGLQQGIQLVDNLDDLIESAVEEQEGWEDLVEKLKDPTFAKQFAKERKTLEKMVTELMELLKTHKERQEKSLRQTHQYTSDLVAELKEKAAQQSADVDKESELIGKIAIFEGKKGALDLNLEALLVAKLEGRDLLKKVGADLEEGNKCLRRYTKLCTEVIKALEKDQVESARINREMRETLRLAELDTAAEREKIAELGELIERLENGGPQCRRSCCKQSQT